MKSQKNIVHIGPILQFNIYKQSNLLKIQQQQHTICKIVWKCSFEKIYMYLMPLWWPCSEYLYIVHVVQHWVGCTDVIYLEWNVYLRKYLNFYFLNLTLSIDNYSLIPVPRPRQYTRTIIENSSNIFITSMD